MPSRLTLLIIALVPASPLVAQLAAPRAIAPTASGAPPQMAVPMEEQIADLRKRLSAVESKLKSTTEQADKAMFLANAVVASSDQQGRDLKTLTAAYNRHKHFFIMNGDTGQAKYFDAITTSEPSEFCKEKIVIQGNNQHPQSSDYHCVVPF